MNGFVRSYIYMISFCSIILISCDPFYTNDTFFNKDARPGEIIQTKTTFFNDLRSGQHIAGNITILFRPDTLTEKVHSVYAFIDSVSLSDNPLQINDGFYILNLNTGNYSDGRHDIHLHVKFHSDELGLGSIFNEYDALIYSTYLVFDQTPPSKINIDSISPANNSLKIKWQHSEDSNFYAYIIKRYDYFDTNLIINDNHLTLCDTIYERERTQFDDTLIDSIFGVSRVYEVINFNRVIGVKSNPKVYSYYKFDDINWPVSNLTVFFGPIFLSNGNSYVISYLSSEVPSGQDAGRITILSYPDNQILANRNDIGAYPIIRNPQGTKIAGSCNGVTYIFSAQDLAVEAQIQQTTIHFNSGYSFSWGYNNNIIIENNVYNTINQSLVKILPFAIWNPNISADYCTIYSSLNDTLSIIDMSSDSVSVIDRKIFDSGIIDMSLDPCLGRIYLVCVNISNKIKIFETPSLQQIGEFTSDGDVIKIRVTQNGIYVLQNYVVDKVNNRITCFDKYSFNKVRHFDFTKAIYNFVISPDGEMIYAFSHNFKKPFIFNVVN